MSFSDIIDIAGTERQETADFGIDDEYDDHVTELDENADDMKINDTVSDEGAVVSRNLMNSNIGTVGNKGTNTRTMKNKQNVLNEGKKSVVNTVKDISKVEDTKVKAKADESYQIKVDVKSGSAEVKRVTKKEPKSPVKRQKLGAESKIRMKTEVKNEDESKDKTEDESKRKFSQQTVTRTYNCTRCNEPFPSTVAHNRHLRSKLCFIQNDYSEPEEHVKCNQCSLKFPRQDYLEVHKTVHEDTVPRNFTVNFMDLYQFLNDVETMDRDADIICLKCGQRFIEKRLLVHHTILIHGMKYECQTCEYICESRYKCWAHQRSHENQQSEVPKESLRQCITCTKTFKTKSDLDRHSMICQTSHVTSYPCDLCKKIFSSEFFLSKHKENTHFKKYSCSNEECAKGFSTEHKLDQHQLVHDDRGFMCSICGKIFNSRAYFHSHMSSHTGERNFECDVCKKTFKTKDVLSKHKKIHDSIRQYCCEICGWRFHQSGSLKKHMDSHLNIKRYQCEVCSKKFSNKTSLDNHKLQSRHFVEGDENDIINAEKAKKCEYCDKLFPPNSLYMYKRHVMIHTGVKPHKCDFCGKSFCDRTNLKYHRLIHLENKPFTCKLCGRGFVQKRGLKKHLESSNPCTISNNVGVTKRQDVDDFKEETPPSAFHTPHVESPDSIGPEMVAVPVTCEQNLQVNIEHNVYTSSDKNIPGHFEHNTSPDSIVNVQEAYEEGLPVSSSQDIQGEAVMNFQGGFTGDAIATAMAIASADDNDADIAKHVTDLSNNSGAVDAAWMYTVKPWK